MAADAVLKIKEAEDSGSELIKSANERAQDIIRNAESDGLQKQKLIVDEANRMKAEMIEEATKRAAQECNALIQQDKKENENIVNPDPLKLERAAEIAMERIVNANGNR